MDHPLRAYLKKHNLRQGAFGASVGINQSTISDILNWRNVPSLYTALRIEQQTGGKVKMKDMCRQEWL